MAINFPDNPSDGDIHAGFTWNAAIGAWKSAAYHTATGNTAPTNPQDGDQWFDTSDGTLYVYFNDGSSSQWVGVSGPQGPAGATGAAGADGSSVTSYANTGSFPSSNNTVGDFAFATDKKALYTWDGNEWDRVRTGVDETPEWTTEPNSSYDLNADGTNTSITVAASDPEGFPITYSFDTNPTNQPQATITNSGGVFNFVPSTNTAHDGSFTMRFKASDGVNITSRSSTINLTFFESQIMAEVYNDSYSTANTGSFTVPDGATKVYFFACAGGGSSGYRTNQDGGHGAGGGGAANITGFQVTASPGDVFDYSVGAGGAFDSGSGGATTVSRSSVTLLQLGGGSGGVDGSGGTGGAGGAGGTVITGIGVAGGAGGTGGTRGGTVAQNGGSATNGTGGGGGGGYHLAGAGGTGGSSTISTSTWTYGNISIAFNGGSGGGPGTNGNPGSAGTSIPLAEAGFGVAQDSNTGGGGGAGRGIQPVVNGTAATYFHGGGGGGIQSYIVGRNIDGRGGGGFLIAVATKTQE